MSPQGSPPAPSTGSSKKQKNKQAMEDRDRQKHAEKKKRRLEKALANSAAIRLELEKKKQRKKEEEQRLEEESAALAEAVALHVLLDEDSEELAHFKTYRGFGLQSLNIFSGGDNADTRKNQGSYINPSGLPWDSAQHNRLCCNLFDLYSQETYQEHKIYYGTGNEESQVAITLGYDDFYMKSIMRNERLSNINQCDSKGRINTESNEKIL